MAPGEEVGPPQRGVRGSAEDGEDGLIGLADDLLRRLIETVHHVCVDTEAAVQLVRLSRR